MTSPFHPVAAGARLSDQVAQQITAAVRSGRLAPGERLPPEIALGLQFGVSRTVVREAVSRLKSLGLVQSRQGSGAFVVRHPPFESLSFDAARLDSRAAVAQMVEVRRGLEAEAAALAAQRRSATELRRIQQAVKRLDRAVADGGDGVDEDLAFHRCIAEAAHNPFLQSTLDFLAQFMRGAIKVTRANEARRSDFADQVHTEHAAILAALQAGDAESARRAAGHHMAQAIVRIETADPAFWAQEGARLARPLLRGLRRG